MGEPLLLFLLCAERGSNTNDSLPSRGSRYKVLEVPFRVWSY